MILTLLVIPLLSGNCQNRRVWRSFGLSHHSHPYHHWEEPLTTTKKISNCIGAGLVLIGQLVRETADNWPFALAMNIGQLCTNRCACNSCVHSNYASCATNSTWTAKNLSRVDIESQAAIRTRESKFTNRGLIKKLWEEKKNSKQIHNRRHEWNLGSK